MSGSTAHPPTGHVQNLDLTHTWNPLSQFFLFFSPSMIRETSQRTVCHALDQVKAKASHVADAGSLVLHLHMYSVFNILQFLACVIKMGVFKRPAAADYWKRPDGRPRATGSLCRLDVCGALWAMWLLRSL